MARQEAASYMPLYSTCMKHGPLCNNRVQWMVNRFQENLLPHKYTFRFFRLVCTCSSNVYQPLEDPWESIVSQHLIDSVSFIDNYISQNIDNPQASVLNEIMKHLRRHHVIPSEQDMDNIDPELDRAEECRTSAFRMLYMLQKAIQGDYSLMELPRRDDGQANNRAQDKILTFVLESFNHKHLGNLIGGQGRAMMCFLRRHKCYIKLDKIPHGDDFKVQATIKKRAATLQTLELIKEELISYANDTQEQEEAYEELREEKLEERKGKFTELLKETEGMGPNAEWNTILYKLEHNDDYDDINRYVEFEIQTQWFEHAKVIWNQIINPVSTSTESTAVVGAEGGRDLPSDSSQPSSLDQAVFAPSVLGNITATRSPQSPTKSHPEAGASPSISNSNNTNQSQKQTVSVGTSTMDEQSCTTLCIVHDRRWVPTFQYFLNQCHTQIALPKKHGYPLSQRICTCNKPDPDTSKFFPDSRDIGSDFRHVHTVLTLWPEEQTTILQPLLRQLEKYSKAETYYSLLKLVFYFRAARYKDYDQLKPDAKLPGDDHHSSTRSSVLASQVQSRPEIGGNQGASGSALAGTLGLGSLSSSSSGGLSTRPPPSTVGGAANETTPTAEESEQDDQAVFQPKIKTVKKLSPSDWVEDCHFHGKKNKFVFQCILNYLHHQACFPVNLNIAFSMSVCCCGENVVFKDYFRSEYDCINDAKFMKEQLTAWRGDSKTSIQPYIALLDKYIEDKTISDGFLKFVCFFKKAFTRDLYSIYELYDQMKQSKK